MFKALDARLRAIGETRALAAARRVADVVRAEIPGVAVDRDGGRVSLSGRGLRRRSIVDARLRWIGGLLK